MNDSITATTKPIIRKTKGDVVLPFGIKCQYVIEQHKYFIVEYHVNKMLNTQKIRTLCIEGNGLGSVHALGALEYMHKTNMLSDLQDIYCYSFGSLIAVCYCVHGSFNELLGHIQSGRVRRRCIRLHAMLKLSVLCPMIRQLNNSILRDTIADILPANVTTLGDLQRISGIRVHVLVCSTTSLTTKVFNSFKHSDVDLVDVLTASCALPFIFNPVVVNNEAFIDGGVYSGMSHIRTCGKGNETVLIGSSGNTTLQYGTNCFEQLWSVLMQVQRRRLKRRQKGILILSMPLMNGVLLYAGTSTLRRMYMNGAVIASAELALRNVKLPVAHMACCGITANTVLIYLPETAEKNEIMKKLKLGGVSVVHEKKIQLTWRKAICFCGPNRITWSE